MPVRVTSILEERHRDESLRAVRPRHHLVQRMLIDRSVPRIICASHGFGKTTLAREYARQVFSGIGVVCLDASDPTFLCSLDEATFPVLPSTFEGPLRLLLVDDLPFLDEVRRKSFSEAIDEQISKGVEVICTVIPSHDVMSTMGRDTITLHANDLFVNDREFEEERSRMHVSARGRAGDSRQRADGTAVEQWVASIGRSTRDEGEERTSHETFPLHAWGIPSLVWGDPSYAAAHCIEAFFEEHLPHEFTDVASAMILLQEGSYRMLEEMGVMPAPEVMGILEKSYPLFGIDPLRRTFSTIPLASEDLQRLHLDIPEEWMVEGGVIDGVLTQLAGRGRWGYALALVDSHLPLEGIEGFLRRYGRNLIDTGFSQRVSTLCERLEADGRYGCSLMTALHLWALCLSGRRERAYEGYETAVRDGLQDEPLRLVAKLFGLSGRYPESGHLPRGRQGASDNPSEECEDLRDRGCLQRYIANGCSDCTSRHPSGAGGCLSTMLMLTQLADGQDPVTSSGGPAAAEMVVETLRRSAHHHEDPLWRLALHTALVGLLEGDGGGGEDLFEMSESLRGKRSAGPSHSITEALLAKDHALHVLATGSGKVDRADECAADRTLSGLGRSLDERILDDMGEARRLPVSRMLMIPCPTELRKPNPEIGAEVPDMEDPDVEIASAGSNRKALELYIRMFGGFQVQRGGVAMENRLLEKRQVRQMIAYLALNKGREVPRERIFMEMWPNSNTERARNSFYIVWSHIRRALDLDEPGRQYIVVRESTLAINPQLVDCDIYRFEELHRKLVCLPSDSEGLVESFVELERLYRGDLLTCEFSSDYFDMQRDWYREMFVDSMVGASERSADEGDAKVALWFARKAFEYGFEREDAYCALMRALILNNQKTSAIRTFNTCRDFLASELDATPSQRTVELYRKARDDTRPSTLII